MILTPIGSDPSRYAVRLPDPDVPIRRIFALPWLCETLREGKLSLVAPHAWDDPHEDLATRCLLDGKDLDPPLGQQGLDAYLAPAWAQCWTTNLGSDALLRAYSRVTVDKQSCRNTTPEAEGVAVTTTVGRLLQATEAWNTPDEDIHVVLGKVTYVEEDEISQRIVNVCNGQDGPQFFQTVQGRTDSLLLKRRFFEHEQEVRLIAVARTSDRTPRQEERRLFPIQPNDVFDSISIDPRLSTFEAREREATIRACGFKGEIKQDLTYQGRWYLLAMTSPWRAP